MFTNKKQKIEELYRNILFRDPDESGLKSYLNVNLDFLEEILLNSEERKQLLLKNDILLDMPRDLPKSASVSFWDTDTEELYKQNKIELGQNWLWYNKNVNYTLNSLGYRMKEFSDIDWSNYIATFGCSFTAGTGLSLEDTWSYRISKDIECDLVNAAIPGGGNETILINLSKILSHKQKPKMVIVSWSAITRKCYWYNGNVLLYGSITQNNKLWEQAYHNYINNKQQWAFEFIQLKKQVDLICQLANIPVWHMTNFNEYNFIDSVEKILPLQSDGSMYGINNWAARDYNIKTKCSHPGIELQDRVFSRWLELKHNFGF